VSVGKGRVTKKTEGAPELGEAVHQGEEWCVCGGQTVVGNKMGTKREYLAILKKIKSAKKDEEYRSM